MHIVKIWDLPTRLFHWALVILMVCLWRSAEVGEMEMHQIFAYILCSLLLFRFIWGFLGSDTSRFRHFIYHPKQIYIYLKETKKAGIKPNVGHNPLGGYMVLVLLLLLSVQFISGLFASDDVLTTGPLNYLVSDEQASMLTSLHHFNFNMLLALIAIHIAAVVVHQIKGDKVLSAMFSGKREFNNELFIDAKPIKFVSNWLALFLFILLIGIISYFFIFPLIDTL